MAHALGVDLGTTNAKVTIVSDDGRLVASANRHISAFVDGDIATLDAEAQWQAVADAIAAVTSAVPDAAADVVAIGVCSQYSSIVPVDAGGRPVAEMRLWSDRRGTDRSFEVLAKGDDVFFGFIERHGIPPVGGGLSLGHILHLQHDCPELHDRTAAYLEPMDYVNARLTGRLAANQATMFMSQLIDNRSLGQTRYDDQLVEWAGVDVSRLPELLTLSAPVGTVLGDVAAELGVPDTAVVYAAINDTHAGSVAAGVSRPGWAGLSIGTTSVLSDAMGHKEVDLDHEVLSSPGPFDDEYLVFAENGLGGKPLEHVLENIVYATDELADHAISGSFDALDAALAAVPAGSGGLLFLPWLRGSMAPANETAMRGGFINMGLDTGRREMVRATCEGVAHNLRWLLPHVEALTGNAVQDITFLGGAAQSAGWTQILADVLDRPVSVAADPASAIARGTGLLALHRHGTLTRADLVALATTASTIEPDPAHRAVYDRHQPQFEAAFHALRPIAQALND